MPCGCRSQPKRWTVHVEGTPTGRKFTTRNAAERYAARVSGEVHQITS